MEHAERVIDAFKANEIEKILLIDDAYDPPVLNGGMAGRLLDFWENDDSLKVCIEAGIGGDDIDLAINSLKENEHDAEVLLKVYEKLYELFLETEDEKFDPGKLFNTSKGATLGYLKPLTDLLKKCGSNVEVDRVGEVYALERYKEKNPQVVFLDYYLNQDVPPAGEATDLEKSIAKKASMDILKGIIINTVNSWERPAVVLMSSYSVGNQIAKYRNDAGKEIMLMRFRFMKKEGIKLEGRNICIEHDAADALLDTSQGYVFGATLQQALETWKTGAEKALEGLIEEINELDLKDFAYLLRFRLRDEGQSLGSYLEWLFGESMRGLIDEKVDWKHASFCKLDDQPECEEGIEGAFDGPTKKIAELFHRVRVEPPRNSKEGEYRLGDIYADLDGSGIRTVITPDCDLVIRSNGNAKVQNLLTMGGTLSKIDAGGSSAEDFFLHDEKAYSVRWNPKKLETFPLTGEGALAGEQTQKFLGTLRPLYAQHMQRQALEDLARIGLPVAPAFGIDATISIYIRINSDPLKKLPLSTAVNASIIPARNLEDQRKHGHTLIVRRSFVHNMIDELKKIDQAKLKADDAEVLNELLKVKSVKVLYSKLLKGVSLNEKKAGPCGIRLRVSDKPKGGEHFLQLLIKVSDEALAELKMIDPLMDIRE